jgi:site-specific recombinase XerD
MSDNEVSGDLIREQNKQLINEFEKHLQQSGISKKTVKSQTQDLDFFTEYLVYYEPLEKLSKTDTSDVSDFLDDFFPRKALWANQTSVKQYITVFKKFFKWMIAIELMKEEEYEVLLDEIKESKEEWLSSVDDF